MSKTEQTSDNPQNGNSSLGIVMHWVAVSERLPEIGTITDVYITAGHRVTNYTWESHDLQSSFMPHEITYWIAIPEPPCA
jgi:hypothetical protein